MQYPTHFAVIDHGDPVKSGKKVVTTVIAAGEGAGTEVPLFRQDGDPDDPGTATTVVWRSAGNANADCDGAVAEAERLNENEG